MDYNFKITKNDREHLKDNEILFMSKGSKNT